MVLPYHKPSLVPRSLSDVILHLMFLHGRRLSLGEDGERGYMYNNACLDLVILP